MSSFFQLIDCLSTAVSFSSYFNVLKCEFSDIYIMGQYAKLEIGLSYDHQICTRFPQKITSLATDGDVVAYKIVKSFRRDSSVFLFGQCHDLRYEAEITKIDVTDLILFPRWLLLSLVGYYRTMLLILLGILLLLRVLCLINCYSSKLLFFFCCFFVMSEFM